MIATIWWVFFVSVVVIVIVGTAVTHQQVEEGFVTCDILDCLDKYDKNDKYVDIQTYYDVMQQLQADAADIKMRTNITYDIGTIVMTNIPVQNDPFKNAETVTVGGQIPALTLNFLYPEPQTGPRGPPGPDGAVGPTGATGAVGPMGPPGYAAAP